MKSTKKTSLIKKINFLTAKKELSKASLVYGYVMQITNGVTNFRPVFTQGNSWKHSSLIDKTNEFSSLLNKLGIEYKLTNDAPRGGKTGALVTITTKLLK